MAQRGWNPPPAPAGTPAPLIQGGLPFQRDQAREVASLQARAHTAGSAAGLEAWAYTAGSVAFGASPGLTTVAHEAAHVVQQRGGVVDVNRRAILTPGGPQA